MPRKIGHFVLGKTGLARGVDQCVVHRAGQRFVDVEFAGFKLFKQRSVLLVDDLVAGEVFAPECDSLGHCGLPNIHSLAWDGEHEVDVDVVEARLAQAIERFENHLSRMNTAEALE